MKHLADLHDAEMDVAVYEYRHGTRHAYGNGLLGQAVVFFLCPIKRDGERIASPPFTAEAFGEFRVYGDIDDYHERDLSKTGTLLRSFRFYPRSIAEYPDYPSDYDARRLAEGYAYGYADGCDATVGPAE